MCEIINRGVNTGIMDLLRHPKQTKTNKKHNSKTAPNSTVLKLPSLCFVVFVEPWKPRDCFVGPLLCSCNCRNELCL